MAKMRDKVALTYERLCEVLDVDLMTGVLTWRVVRGSNRKVGNVAGSIWRKTYPSGTVERRVIMIDGKLYHASHLVWFFAKGEYPTFSIDHSDRNTLNDAYANLRPADQREQNRNRRLPAGKYGSLAGVMWNAQDNRYQAKVKLDGRNIPLGSFYVNKIGDKVLAENLAAATTDFVKRHVFGEFYCPPEEARRAKLPTEITNIVGSIGLITFQNRVTGVTAKDEQALMDEADAREYLSELTVTENLHRAA